MSLMAALATVIFIFYLFAHHNQGMRFVQVYETLSIVLHDEAAEFLFVGNYAQVQGLNL